jgi:ABC-type uncharacterized transport system permease subunit
MASISCIIFWILVPFIAIGAMINYLILETQPQRIRRLRATGMTQKAIAESMGITVYRVRKALA